jgi:N-acetyl-alpha-D-muramate 1-phosphate uridylyltransferase
MQIVIMAGGLGTRLRPLTYDIPKPMIPIHGKPYLWYQLDYLKKYHLNHILILAGYLGQQIENYFGNGSELDIKIQYSFESEPMGTGGGLKFAAPLLEDEFMVIYGDSFLPIDLSDLIKTYRFMKSTGLLVVYDNRFGDSNVKNNVAIDGNNLILKYQKNTDDDSLNYVESGISVFNKSICELIPANKKTSLEEEIFPKLIDNKKLKAYITTQRFYDIGTPDRLKTIETFFQI